MWCVSLFPFSIVESISGELFLVTCVKCVHRTSSVTEIRGDFWSSLLSVYDLFLLHISQFENRFHFYKLKLFFDILALITQPTQPKFSSITQWILRCHVRFLSLILKQPSNVFCNWMEQKMLLKLSCNCLLWYVRCNDVWSSLILGTVEDGFLC